MKMESFYGLVQFWIHVSDPFGTIDKVLLNITIHETAATSKSSSASLGMESVISREMGQFNATHWIRAENLGGALDLLKDQFGQFLAPHPQRHLLPCWLEPVMLPIGR